MDKDEVIGRLWAGTATDADVYAALGWEIRPHSRMGGGVCRIDGGRCVGLDRVTGNAGDALYLIRSGKKEEAVRDALSLNGTMSPNQFGNCPIARRICVVALTRTDLRAPRWGGAQ